MTKVQPSLVDTQCPCCGDGVVAFWAEDKRRRYLVCSRCHLVFVPANFHLSPEAEKAEYDLHNNDINDPGYRRFLSRLAEPLVARLPENAYGLDFGCGPGPALVSMLQDAGFSCEKYDLFYCPDKEVLAKRYGFITATEVIEHLAQPLVVLDSLWQQLDTGGILALMTKRVKDRAAFNNWHYKNDQTHISFFADETFRWLAKRWGAELDFIDNDVVFLTKL